MQSEQIDNLLFKYDSKTKRCLVNDLVTNEKDFGEFDDVLHKITMHHSIKNIELVARLILFMSDKLDTEDYQINIPVEDPTIISEIESVGFVHTPELGEPHNYRVDHVKPKNIAMSLLIPYMN